MYKKCLPFALMMLSGLLLSACFEFGFRDSTGYVPVYGDPGRTEIRLSPSRSVVDPGKIYVYGTYLLVNEKGEGIHIFDNSSPDNPVGLGFIQILGNNDMAIRDGVLYADHVGTIVALTLNDFKELETTGRLDMRAWEYGVPPPQGFRYQCVEPGKGLVVGWRAVKNHNLDCYAVR